MERLSVARTGRLTRDGKWRKVKVKVNPFLGLSRLNVHARTVSYAPLPSRDCRGFSCRGGAHAGSGGSSLVSGIVKRG
jgi:hypothetical protein